MEEPKKRGLFSRLKQGLSRTRAQLTEGLASFVLGKKQIDAALLEQIETLLLQSDLGVSATTAIIDELTARIKRNALADGDALWAALRELLVALLMPVQKPLELPVGEKPFVILMVGVNGAGKTTTIGKLAKRFQAEGKSVLLAAGDTFRAAAVEQLQIWGERNHVPVIAQQAGADSASVVFDALQAATARGMDVLLADTAGRLHTQTNLMTELEKVKRVMGKIDAKAPQEVLLILDGSSGQNALAQAKQFSDSVGVTGIVLTKLDGTAKGGIIFAIAQQLEIPIRFIGVGEGIDDLQVFNAAEFVDALFEKGSDS
jgi:fused signal recognition particle receptor